MQNENKSFLMKLCYLTARFKKKKLMFGIIGAAGISIALYLVLSGPSKASGEYLTGTVKKGTITKSISASGSIEPVSTISMSFKNAEIVKKIYVNVGDNVKKGQLLAELNTSNLETDVRQAKANLKSAQASLNALLRGATQVEKDKAEADMSKAQASYDVAKSTLERNRELYNAGALSKSELEAYEKEFTNAQAELKQANATLKDLLDGEAQEDIAAAEAKLESARASLEESESDLADATMISPVDGIVSGISGAEGQRASANNNSTSGDGFLELISEALQVKAQVNEGDIGKARVGQKVEFTVNSYPDKKFTGKVSSISPIATTESNVQIYDVIIQLDENYDELKAGMPSDVTVIVEQSEDVLTIPKGAVTYAESYATQQMDATSKKNTSVTMESAQGKSAMVLVMGKSGSPEPRRVELGLSDLTNYEVISGLSEGETVITGSMSQTTTSGDTEEEGSKENRKSQGVLGGPGGPPPGGGGPN